MKTLAKYCIVLLSLLLSPLSSTATSSGDNQELKYEDFKHRLVEFRSEYGTSKKIAKEFELPILVALSFYPELKNIHINFEYGDTKTTMETRPALYTLLKVLKRSYTVYIDNNTIYDGILLQDAPFNAQVGILGHELAHIVDYESRSTINIIGVALKYSVAKCRANFEKKIDKITISKGLGWQLHGWSDYVLHQSCASESYKNYKRKNYLTPEEIVAELGYFRRRN